MYRRWPWLVRNHSGFAQQPYDPTGDSADFTEPGLVVEWAIPESVGNEIQTDRVTFGLTFYAQQARHADGANNPCDTGDDGPGNGGENGDSGNGGPDQKGISFVAFCVDSGTIATEDVTEMTITETKDGEEPVAISWATSTAVDHVVLKTGGGRLATENFPGGFQKQRASGRELPARWTNALHAVP